MKVGSQVEGALDTLSKDGSKKLRHEEAHHAFRQQKHYGGRPAQEQERLGGGSNPEAASPSCHGCPRCFVW
jgi:hypothetical protein